jgi:cell division protein FtsB
LLRAVKRRFLATLPPAVFLAITYYFAWNAVHGRSGLEAQAAQRAALRQVAQNFATVDAQRAEWETRIADLSGPSITGDMLDEQARQVLNLADPDDLVIELPQKSAGK